MIGVLAFALLVLAAVVLAAPRPAKRQVIRAPAPGGGDLPPWEDHVPARGGLPVDGVMDHQELLREICGEPSAIGEDFPCRARLAAEPKGVVGVWLGADRVGQLRPDHARRLAHPLPMECAAKIVGGWDRGPGDRGSYGLRLQRLRLTKG